MKRFSLLIILAFLFVSCGGKNEDGSRKDTYSSCKITSSNAIFSGDRARDLKQCWNASGEGYTSQSDALRWCEAKVLEYYKNSYLTGSVNAGAFAVESTYCQ